MLIRKRNWLEKVAPSTIDSVDRPLANDCRTAAAVGSDQIRSGGHHLALVKNIARCAGVPRPRAKRTSCTEASTLCVERATWVGETKAVLNTAALVLDAAEAMVAITVRDVRVWLS